MCIATGLVYSVISVFYLQEAAEFDPEQYKLPLNDLPKLLESLKINDVFVVFAWTAEFSVKISLLLFFRRLVNRLPRLTLYVKFVMGFATVVWAVLLCEPFLLCPYFGLAAICEFYRPTVLSLRGTERSTAECVPTNVQLTIALTVFIILLDILTDIMSMLNPTSATQVDRANLTSHLHSSLCDLESQHGHQAEIGARHVSYHEDLANNDCSRPCNILQARHDL